MNVAVRPACPREEGARVVRAVGLAGRREECAVRTACPRREAA